MSRDNNFDHGDNDDAVDDDDDDDGDERSSGNSHTRELRRVWINNIDRRIIDIGENRINNWYEDKIFRRRNSNDENNGLEMINDTIENHMMIIPKEFYDSQDNVKSRKIENIQIHIFKWIKYDISREGRYYMNYKIKKFTQIKTTTRWIRWCHDRSEWENNMNWILSEKNRREKYLRIEIIIRMIFEDIEIIFISRIIVKMICLWLISIQNI